MVLGIILAKCLRSRSGEVLKDWCENPQNPSFPGSIMILQIGLIQESPKRKYPSIGLLKAKAARIWM